MLQTIRKRGFSVLWTPLLGALLAIGLLLPVFHALEMPSTGAAVRACVFTMLCCIALEWGMEERKHRPVILAAIAAIFLYLLLSGALGNLPGMLRAAVMLIRGSGESLRAYGPQAATFAAVAMTIAGWFMARHGAGFYPALSLTMIALLIIWFSGRRDAIWLFAPSLIALCAMFARAAGEDTPAARIIIVSSLVVVLATAVSPVLQVRSLWFEQAADKLRTFITDTLFYTETRSVYSIQADGFKPLETRLGGPIDPPDRPVMTVETPASLLLRGTIYDRYSGLNWGISLSSHRYLYMDPRNRSIRADTLDEQRPTQAVKDATDLFLPAQVHITMQSDSASSLFVPLRFDSLSTPMALVPYFNLSSEIFITRDLQVGDTYSFTSPIIKASDTRLAGVLSSAVAQLREDPNLSAYLHLPDHISQDVYSLTYELIAGASTPYEQALSIQNHLRTSYRYTLTPEVPPVNQDFVSYFLLRGKEGYCTYFASAMAVMGRIAGLPTRYVEGYLAEPSGGVALVTSRQAHAWAEVYFEGFGWIPFDSTPPRSRGGPRADETPGQQDLQQQQEPHQEEEQPQDEQETPDGGQQDMERNEENQQGPQGGAAQEPTPTPKPLPPDVPEPDVDDPLLDQDDPPKRRGSWWLWLIVALAATAALIWRGLSTRPRVVAAQRRGDDIRLLTWYRALLGLLECAGMPQRIHETPIAYAARVAQGIPEEARFSAVAAAVTKVGYARSGANEEDVIRAGECYDAIWKAIPVKGKIKWLARRMVKGLGSIRQVP